MARFEFQGIDEYLADIKELGKKATGTIKYAVYPGAGVVADAIREEIETKHLRPPNEKSKYKPGALAKSLTLTEMEKKDGFIYTCIRFAGYDSRGVPNQIKANVLESGTSDGRVKATHFLSRTLQRVKDQCEKAMADALDEKIGEIMDK